MVAHLIRMRLALTVNGWRRSTFQLVLAILAMVSALGLLLMLGLGAGLGLPLLGPTDRGTVLVFGCALAVVLWVLIPIFLTGVDLTLDPANFSTFALPARTLVAGLAVSSLVTVPGAATLVGFLLSTLAWRDTPAALLAGVPAAVAGALFCLCISYAVAGLLAAYTGRRRIREIASLMAFIPLMLGGLAIGAVAESLAQVADVLPDVAAVLAWTPLGSFTAVPWAVAEGRVVTALAQGLLCLVWVAGAAWLWKLAVARSFEQVRGAAPSSSGRAAVRGLGLLSRVPATPAGAVAARALIYWLKDPRYSASLVVLPLLLVVFWFLGYQAGDYSVLLFLGPLTGFMLGFSISADLGYDGSAFALHVTSGISGRDDRLGRAGALLSWGVPVTVLVTVGTVWASGDWSVLPGVMGLALGALLSTTGASSLISARFIYPVQPPGASPFSTPQGSTMRVMLVQLGSMLVTAVLLLPELVLFIIALVTGNELFHWLTLTVGVLLGVVLLWLGIRLGARWFDRAQAETYQDVLRFA